MPGFDVKVAGVELLPGWEDAIVAAALPQIEDIGEQVVEVARGYAPVRTGHLRDSIYHLVDGRTGDLTIGASADYALFVELGHHAGHTWVPPQPFIRPAVYRTYVARTPAGVL